MNRKEQLDQLIESLDQLVNILRHDKNCQWAQHFEGRLQEAKRVRERGFEQKDLNQLSTAVMSVYGGAGSFNDYAPTVFNKETGKITVIQGMEELSHCSELVYQYALALRAVESKQAQSKSKRYN